MKYYVYVSDAKVDMLFAQIPIPLLKRLSAELRIDLKVASVTVGVSAKEATRYDRLTVVLEYLRRNEPFGWVDSPASYFEETIPLVMTHVGSTVAFTGKRGNSLLGLTGSRQHMTGQAPRLGEMNLDSVTHLALPSVAAALASLEREEAEIEISDAVNALAFVIAHQSGSPRPVQVAARTLLVADVRTRSWPRGVRDVVAGIDSVVLGSPLYVAEP